MIFSAAVSSALALATSTGVGGFIIGRYKHRVNKYFAFKRVAENPRIKVGTRFRGIYVEAGQTLLIPACTLESFKPGEMVFRVTEESHRLYQTIISLTVIEFEKMHPFIEEDTTTGC